jgi:hypothetical protein
MTSFNYLTGRLLVLSALVSLLAVLSVPSTDALPFNDATHENFTEYSSSSSEEIDLSFLDWP